MEAAVDFGGRSGRGSVVGRGKRRRRRGILRGFRSPKIAAGAAILAIFILIAIFGPVLDPTDPSATSGAALAGPSLDHLLGTTQTGQDVFAQLVDGTRQSVLVGFVSAGIATLLSLVVGLTAGYLGGAADELLSALANMFLVIPGLPLVIVLAGYLPSRGWISVALVIAVTGWAWGARVLRAQTLSLRHRDFVEAARAIGERPLRIIAGEILPNQVAIIAAGFCGTVTYAIITQASLAFLGLSGISSWSWGTMLYWANTSQALPLGAWWWFVPPGLAIALLGTGLSLINFGIDEFVNPRLRDAGLGTKKAGRSLRRGSGGGGPEGLRVSGAGRLTRANTIAPSPSSVPGRAEDMPASETVAGEAR